MLAKPRCTSSRLIQNSRKDLAGSLKLLKYLDWWGWGIKVWKTNVIEIAPRIVWWVLRSACSIVLRCSCSCIHSMYWFIVWEVLHTPSNTIMLWQHSCEDASASMRCAAPLCYPLSQMPSNIIRLRLPSRSNIMDNDNAWVLISRKHLQQRINVWTTVPRLLHTVHQNDTLRKERRRELRRPRRLLSHRLDAQLNCVKKVRSNFGEVVPVLPHSV